MLSDRTVRRCLAKLVMEEFVEEVDAGGDDGETRYLCRPLADDGRIVTGVAPTAQAQTIGRPAKIIPVYHLFVPVKGGSGAQTDNRLFWLLFHKADRFGNVRNAQTGLAVMLGTTPRTIITSLGRLRDRGLLTWDGQRIRLRPFRIGSEAQE